MDPMGLIALKIHTLWDYFFWNMSAVLKVEARNEERLCFSQFLKEPFHKICVYMAHTLYILYIYILLYIYINA